jgi:hypothetical protein
LSDKRAILVEIVLIILVRRLPERESVLPVMISQVAVTPLILAVSVFPDDTRDAVLMIDPVVVTPLVSEVSTFPDDEMVCVLTRTPVAVTPLILVVIIFPELDMMLVLMILPVPTDPPTLLVIVLPVLVSEFGTEREEVEIEFAESAPEIATFPLNWDDPLTVLFPFCVSVPEFTSPLLESVPQIVALRPTKRSRLTVQSGLDSGRYPL